LTETPIALTIDTMTKFLQLTFLPRSYDLALLALRFWLGFGLLLNHGWGKLTHFSQMSGRFADPFHIGTAPSLVLVVFAEIVCSILLIVGFATRLAALIIIIDLGVAFSLIHRFAFSGQHSGELAYAYLGGFVAIFLAGAGRFSIDKA
jgi:putative oxidoreductase